MIRLHSAQAMTDWVGKVIDGRYVVDSVLGEGGMGIVLRARHSFTGVSAAVKLLHPYLRLQDQLAARFLAEARAPATIGHPGIVSVTDAGRTPEGDLYLVMELLQGETLEALLGAGPCPSRRFARCSSRSSTPSRRPTPRA